ncbi:MAG: bifunctional phosphoribosylaminoimidazolecarboxamide formyltransferase/IMP cyclohydrolase [Deltaproteobacteria bacterium]
MAAIKRALISLSDKKGIVEFARGLSEFAVEIISTGGTAKLLSENGIKVTEVSDYTGFPEMMDGRLKTLHPKVHGGLLAMRDNPDHLKAMEEHDIKPIDMVVVNLYPFEATIAKGAAFEEAIENIDIGGPTMLRSAAKNHRDVAVVTDPDDYQNILEELEKNSGSLSADTHFRLTRKVFELTARYDGAIANYLGRLEDRKPAKRYPDTLSLQYRKAQDLRYGENPHQSAAFYVEREIKESCISNAKQLQGKELSFNNILDIDGAYETVKEFQEIAAVIIKHTNPCGVAISYSSLASAYRNARAADPVSSFGGIAGLNRIVDAETAEEITATFMEAVIAPGYTPDALEVFKKSKNLRLLQAPIFAGHHPGGLDIKKVVGGVLVQDRDMGSIEEKDLKVVTRRKPTDEELKALLFAWKVCKHVKSNAIVYALKDRTVGVGAGQMSRVDSSKIAAIKGHGNLKGTVAASDAFFPFRDGIDTLAEAGATAIIQPGGSMRDDEVIEAANEHGLAMVFTGMRHFRH